MVRSRSTILTAAVLLALVAPPAVADDVVPPDAVASPEAVASPDGEVAPDAVAPPEAAAAPEEGVPVIGDDRPLDVQAADPQPGAQVAAPAADDFTFTGHGWGHGRGMGQYGALGYALDHGWTYEKILDHYYGGTTKGTTSNDPIEVELVVGESYRPSRVSIVVAAKDLRVNGTPVTGDGLDVVRVSRLADGTYEVTRGSTCEGAFPESGRLPDRGPVVTLSSGSQTSYDDLVRVCETGNVMRAYRGDIVVRDHRQDPSAVFINRTSVENYLRGVVPRESPASWGSLGDGKGMEALRAQAVAARSYALASTRPSGATTCDTTSCQVYRGAAIYRWNGSAYVRSTATNDVLEQPNTNQAVADTAGQIRVFTGTGKIARTEFSSSTGGWTAGGDFPAVQDLGDATSRNPNHTWTVTMTPAQLAARLGLPPGVSVRSIAVTGRSGVGSEGGRVTQLTWVGSNGVTYQRSAAPQADTIRSLLGLRSNWFSVDGPDRAQAEALVRALYEDLLGRAPDASGLSTWTRELLAGRGQSALVEMLTNSEEYRLLRIRQGYQETLGRAPEPGGVATWMAAIRAGTATVDDVTRRFLASEEFRQKSGGTDAGYVRRMYLSVLGREATAAEVTHWTGRIAAVGRVKVTDDIWFSLEAARKRAGGYYQVFLKRTWDAAGRDVWANVLLTRGEGAVRIGIAGSAEYRIKALQRFPG